MRSRQSSDQCLADGGVEKQLELWKINVSLRRVDNLLSTLFDGLLKERYDISRLVVQLMSDLFVICDEVCDVDVAVVLLR